MLALVVLCVTLAAARRDEAHYTFYRSMGGARGWGGAVGGTGAGGAGESSSRRVFGGTAAELSLFPPVCVLLDRYWTARCTASVVSPRWALTAAHCVSPHISYVKYNTRRPAAPEGDLAAVHYLYRHPGYKVMQQNDGRGMDVTLLHHDLGLVRTRADMRLLTVGRPTGPLRSMRTYNPVDLKDEDVQILGFGRTEQSNQGEELFEVQLKLVYCHRAEWYHCMCGMWRAAIDAKDAGEGSGASSVPAGGKETSRSYAERGVCSGDSGGPVLYRGVQIGVTSMGPIECAARSDPFGPGPVPSAGSTSVFTTLYNYAELVNATIYDTEAALRMRIINAACSGRGARAAPLVTLALLVAVR